ncbi:hypothetical protein MEO94_29180, partial [Dolichospermum sp. ST_sed9]|nr:hypothetical protein [Dolichospermum sp. ST_sed9]
MKNFSSCRVGIAHRSGVLVGIAHPTVLIFISKLPLARVFIWINSDSEARPSGLSNKFGRIRNEPRRHEGHEGRRKKEESKWQQMNP